MSVGRAQAIVKCWYTSTFTVKNSTNVVDSEVQYNLEYFRHNHLSYKVIALRILVMCNSLILL